MNTLCQKLSSLSQNPLPIPGPGRNRASTTGSKPSRTSLASDTDGKSQTDSLTYSEKKEQKGRNRLGHASKYPTQIQIGKVNLLSVSVLRDLLGYSNNDIPRRLVTEVLGLPLNRIRGYEYVELNALEASLLRLTSTGAGLDDGIVLRYPRGDEEKQETK